MPFDDPMDHFAWDEFLDWANFDCPGCGARLGPEQTHWDEQAQCHRFACPICRTAGQLREE